MSVTPRRLANTDTDILIIGAWGSGAFSPQNDPTVRTMYVKSMAGTIAEFATVFRNVYDVIVVAIPNISSENYKLFYEAFKTSGLI